MILQINTRKTAELLERIVRDIEERGKDHGGWMAQLLPDPNNVTLVGIVGNTHNADEDVERDHFRQYLCVDGLVKASKHPNLITRSSFPEYNGSTRVVRIPRGNGEEIEVGGRTLSLIEGPCTVESREQTLEIALAVKEAGATALRGGAFKPRADPRSFMGLGAQGLEILREAYELTGLPIVTEITSLGSVLANRERIDYLALVGDIFGYDAVSGTSEVPFVVQIGTRNGENQILMASIASYFRGIPNLVKRHYSEGKLDGFLANAQTPALRGNLDIILCERGLKVEDTYQRNIADFAAIAELKKRSFLPVIFDPSHATGYRHLVRPACYAGIMYGADGLIIEVARKGDDKALDYKQSVFAEQIGALNAELRELHKAEYAAKALH